MEAAGEGPRGNQLLGVGRGLRRKGREMVTIGSMFYGPPARWARQRTPMLRKRLGQSSQHTRVFTRFPYAGHNII